FFAPCHAGRLRWPYGIAGIVSESVPWRAARFRHDALEPGVGGAAALDARLAAGAGRALRRLLGAALRLCAPPRLSGRGSPRPDARILRPAVGKALAGSNRSRQ